MIEQKAVHAEITCSRDNPLKRGGNHLSFLMKAEGDQTFFNAAVQRAYVGPEFPAGSVEHTVTFSMRFDGTTGDVNASALFGAFGNAPGSSNFVPASSWLVRVSASGSLKWQAYDGPRDGGAFDIKRMREIGGRGAGLLVKLGQVYTITIHNRPYEGSYDVEVSDGVQTVKSEGLGYRSKKEDWAPATPSLAFQSQLASADNTVSFSVDSIRVVAGEQ